MVLGGALLYGIPLLAPFFVFGLAATALLSNNKGLSPVARRLAPHQTGAGSSSFLRYAGVLVSQWVFDTCLDLTDSPNRSLTNLRQLTSDLGSLRIDR